MSHFLSNASQMGAVAATAAVSVLLASLVWWAREKKLNQWRRLAAELNGLSEQILSARSPAEILKRLEQGLQTAVGASTVRVFAFSRESRALEPVGKTGEAMPVGREPDKTAPQPVRAFASGDVVSLNDPSPGVRSALCVPMFAQGEVDGVLQLEFDLAARSFDRDERASLQHLANQISIALKLLDQQFLREQILRGEKLGAAGQLISGVAQELRTPLELIAERAQRMVARSHEVASDRELRAIASEAARASDTLARLVSFSRGEQSRARPLVVNTLLRSLAEFRAQQWRLKGITSTVSLTAEEPVILGAQGQIEQALLSLLLHSEQSLENARERRLEVATRVRNNRVLIEIDYTGPTQAASEAETGAWGLDVCRGILENHGGSLVHRPNAGRTRFEVELPLTQASGLSQPASRTASPSARPMTFLLAEPDVSSQRHLVNLLSARHHRVVPTSGGTDTLDLAQRLRFDAVISSTRLADMAWVELCERVRRHTGSIIILSEDAAINAASNPVPETMVLHKPVDDAALDEVLAAISVGQAE